MASAGARGERFLPPDPRVEEPYLLTPRMALRVAVLGVIALVVFAVLVLRLWSLQILSGTKYRTAALSNQLRTVRIDAPRGPIEDRYGRVLVTNVAGTAIDIWPADLPRHGRSAELRRLAWVLHMPLSRVLARLDANPGDLLTPVTIQTAVHQAQVDYLAEHSLEFPGVHSRTIYLRKYNSQALLAHELGYVGEISPSQLRQLRSQGYEPGDQVGQAGVELVYDRYLRGSPEIDEVQVNALGIPVGTPIVQTAAVPGDAIQLTVDIALQRAAERALRYGITLAHKDGFPYADGGAIVAMNPNDGEILAIASNPTFKPSIFVGRPTAKDLAPLLNPKTAQQDNYPGLDRATMGLYPPGSTWKPVTALAALETGILSPSESLQCTGSYTVHGQVFHNWDPYVNQPMTIPEALAASCDTFFYQVGYDFYLQPASKGPELQGWASRFGFGEPTGLDVGPEASGLLPTPAWRRATYTPKTDPKGWQIDRSWKPGNSIQLAIGQQDLTVTPLQMVRLYSLIANGGNLVTPRLVRAVQVPGTPGWQYLTPPAPKPSGVDPNYLAVVRDGLYQATHAADGTSTAIFGNFPIPVAGKTGTAEKVVQLPGWSHPTIQDQAWWCGYAPVDKPQIAVCAVIENGGHGSTAAAPAALRVFEQYFHSKAPGPIGLVHSE